ncbi:MAG TPA: hypothetical protein VD997_11885 [Phycisphaerales bacterium]|nr:hypothetical protein [Phycisphaerales bacterium]
MPSFKGQELDRLKAILEEKPTKEAEELLGATMKTLLRAIEGRELQSRAYLRISRGLSSAQRPWFAEILKQGPKDVLRTRAEEVAGSFKQSLRDALTRELQDPPTSAVFVSTSGQWVKPILRKLIRFDMDITVYLANPWSETVRPGPLQALSTFEFLAALPVALELGEKSPGRLQIRTYPSGLEPLRIVYFKDALLATNASKPEDIPPHLRGHPMYEREGSRWQGPQRVNVCLRGDPEFVLRAGDVEKQILAVKNVSADCLRWDCANGFIRLGNFNFDFKSYFASGINSRAPLRATSKQ